MCHLRVLGISCLLIVLVGSPRSESAQPSFTGVGDLPGGQTHSTLTDLTADNAVAVGNSRSAAGLEACRWTASGGLQSLGFMAGVTGVSGDGSVVVALSSSSMRAVRWTQAGGAVELGVLPGSTQSRGYAVSTDGAVVVGGSSKEAFRWTPTEGMVGLGFFPGVNQIVAFTEARGCSRDGSVIVGKAQSTNGTEGFRWTAGGGLQGVGDLSGGVFYSQAYDVSEDGLVIAGESMSANGREAFRWTPEGMVGLGDLPGGSFFSIAWCVSGDGSAVGGFGTTASGNEAFLWTAATGMVNVRELLTTQYGLDLTGWTLTNLGRISIDGTTLIGSGTHNGNQEGWVATIPEPATGCLCALAAGVILARRRSGRA